MKNRRPAAPRTRHKPTRRPTAPSREVSALSAYLPRLARAIATGMTVAAVVASLLCAVGAAVLSGLPDPDAVLLPLGLGLGLSIAALYGGIVGRLSGERTLTGGLIGGLWLLLVLLLLRCLPPIARGGDVYPVSLLLPLHGALLLFSLLGAYLGARLPLCRRRGRR